MNVTASEYANRIEMVQLTRAQELIALMRDFLAEDKLEVIVDIGCGSGKLTTVIKEAFACHRVIGIDFDHNMIDYANANNKLCNDIEFLTQNIDCEWNEMRPELKALEGRVSLVFTNYALHWIRMKENAVKNIHRLLTNSGKFFAVFLTVPDPLKGLSPINDNEIQNCLKIATKEQQHHNWLNLLNDIGFTIEKSDLVAHRLTLTEESYRNSLQKMILKWLSVYVEATNETERNELINKYGDIIMSGHNKIASECYVNEQTGQKMVDNIVTHFITRAIKK